MFRNTPAKQEMQLNIDEDLKGIFHLPLKNKLSTYENCFFSAFFNSQPFV